MAAQKKDFSPAYGIVPPLITPFKRNEEIDWYAYDRLIDWHIERGVDGLFVVCGSSEYFTLSEDEAVQLAKAAVKRANGQIHILAGSTNYASDDLERNIAMTKRMWEETGVDGCFITTPRLLPAEDKLQLDYFLAIHDAVDCPVYAYEMPHGTRYLFSPEAFAQLGKHERFIGIKDTSTQDGLPLPDAIASVKAKIEAATGTIKIMQANTKYLVESFELGATGGINIAANVAPRLYAVLWKLWRKGQIERAKELEERLDKVDQMQGFGYMKSAKIALALMGLPIEPVTRLDKPEFDNQRTQVLRDMLAFIRKTEEEFPMP